MLLDSIGPALAPVDQSHSVSPHNCVIAEVVLDHGARGLHHFGGGSDLFEWD